jgi:hypothetical protein
MDPARRVDHCLLCTILPTFFNPGSDPAPSSLAGGAVLRTSATASKKQEGVRSAVRVKAELPQSCANYILYEMFLAMRWLVKYWSNRQSKHPVGTNLDSINKAFPERPRAPRGKKQNPPANGRGVPVAGGGPVRCDNELGP